jgi:hypothetical protein
MKKNRTFGFNNLSVSLDLMMDDVSAKLKEMTENK